MCGSLVGGEVDSIMYVCMDMYVNTDLNSDRKRQTNELIKTTIVQLKHKHHDA